MAEQAPHLTKKNLKDTAFESFFSNLIDDASLLFDATLSVKEKMERFFYFQQSDEGWVLGKCLIPFSVLDQVLALIKQMKPALSKPLYLAVNLDSADTKADFLPLFERELIELAGVNKQLPEAVRMESLEFCLPSDVVEKKPAWAVYELLNEMADIIEIRFPKLKELYIQADQMNDWKNTIAHILDGIGRHKKVRQNGIKCFLTGLKISNLQKDDGTTVSLDSIALALRYGANANIPLKFGGGLQSSIRFFCEHARCKKHGFLNVITAGLMYAECGLEDDLMKQILSEEFSERFQFTEKELTWYDYKLDTEQIRKHRKRFLISIATGDLEKTFSELRHCSWD